MSTLQYTSVYLKNFKGGLHLARGLSNSYDRSLQVLHSDTLKSAIYVCALQLYPDLAKEEQSIAFLKSFKISSAFPFLESNKLKRKLHFFPKPELVRLPISNDNDKGLDKKLKKARYMELSFFQQVLKNARAEHTLDEGCIQSGYLSAKEVNLTEVFAHEGCDTIFTSAPYQHVNILSEDELDPKPYFVDKLYFHPQGGLFFLLDSTDDKVKEKVLSAMKLLADSGIGTDRNIGNGQFEVDYSTIEIEVPTTAKYEVNLSLYCPHRTEIGNGSLKQSYYSIAKRGGYISSPQYSRHLTIRKKSIFMFTEGSLFPKNDVQREGKVVNLKPSFEGLDHPIWRDGQAIFIPINY